MKTTISSLIILLLLLGCNDTNVNPNVDGLKLTINKSSFSLDEPIISHLSNHSISSAFLYHCNFQFTPEIEKKENNSWIHYFAPVCQAIYLSGTTEFAAGKECTDTISINETGTFRLKFYYSYAYKDRLDKSIYSIEFIVK
jgi:hypothetical protein